MSNQDYINNFRQIRLFEIAYQFTKHSEDIAIIPQTGYFLAFDMTGAMKECIHQYTRGDQKYVQILYLKELGHPHGIHHFT